MNHPRVRIAPSPTGNLHIGTLRAALFNWLFAQHVGGTFVLRIEDTDTARSQPEFEDSIIEGLDWMQIIPQEGPIQGGPFGPYRQSERMAIGTYRRVATSLLAQKKAYLCFCSEDELDAQRQFAETEHRPYVYPRTCLHLSPTEIEAKKAAQIPHTIRFKLPDTPICRFTDLIRGEIEFDMRLLSDFVLIKSDGSPSYNFAVVVDDLDMKISHVIRGEDHISNTPRQLALFEALSATPPDYAHLPMILGPDRSKLSKRHGATNVIEYRDVGYLPQALLNYLVLLGWSSPDGKEVMPLSEIISKFGLERISKSGAIFDIAKLKWMNGQIIRTLDASALYTAVQPFLTADQHSRLAKLGPLPLIERIIFSLRDNLDLLADIRSHIEVYLRSESEFCLAARELPAFSATDLDVVSAWISFLDSSPEPFSPEDVTRGLDGIVNALELGKGKVFKPIRLACSGQLSGPHLPEFLSLIPKSILRSRCQFVRDIFTP